MKSVAIVLVCVLLSVLLPAPGAAAPVYRVEHLPAFAPARGYAWDAAAGRPDRLQEIEVPNGSQVVLVDTLGSYYALVVFEGRKVQLAQRDLVWAPEANAPDAVDRIGDRARLAGVGHFPRHSALGRFLFGYGAAALIAAILLAVALLQPLRFIPVDVRIMTLTGGVIAVLLIETAWGLLLGYQAGWLCDIDFGMGRVLCQIAGFFVLLYGQYVLTKGAQALICMRAGVEPQDVRLRWAILAPLPVLFVVMWLADRYIGRAWLQDATIWSVFLLILGVEIACMVRYYRRLGRKWGRLYLLLFGALLLGTIVLVPLALMLGAIALAVVLFGLLVVWLLSIAFQRHPVVVNNYYYNRYYLDR